MRDEEPPALENSLPHSLLSSHTERQTSKIILTENSAFISLSYNCYLCDYSSVDKNELNAHILFNHENTTYPCDYCDYISMDENDLKGHFIFKHGNTKYLGDHCDNKSKSKNSLVFHNESNHDSTQNVSDIIQLGGNFSISTFSDSE